MSATTLQESWVPVLSLEDIPSQGARVVEGAPIGAVAVFRTGDDVFALRDRCPHKGGPLSQGIVHGRQVTCPLHGWTIDLDTGSAAAPDVGCAGKLSVRVEEGRVYLLHSELAGKA